MVDGERVSGVLSMLDYLTRPKRRRERGLHLTPGRGFWKGKKGRPRELNAMRSDVMPAPLGCVMHEDATPLFRVIIPTPLRVALLR
jgi:hypothetical protein